MVDIVVVVVVVFIKLANTAKPGLLLTFQWAISNSSSVRGAQEAAVVINLLPTFIVLNFIINYEILLYCHYIYRVEI